MNSLCFRGLRLIEPLSDLHNGLRLSLLSPLSFHMSIPWSEDFLFLISPFYLSQTSPLRNPFHSQLHLSISLEEPMDKQKLFLDQFNPFDYFFKKLYTFIYLFLAVLGLLCCVGSSLVAVSRGNSLVEVCGLFIVVASVAAEHGLQGVRAAAVAAPGSRAQQLWLLGLVALWHVGSSQIRNPTCASCIGRWTLYH